MQWILTIVESMKSAQVLMEKLTGPSPVSGRKARMFPGMQSNHSNTNKMEDELTKNTKESQ